MLRPYAVAAVLCASCSTPATDTATIPLNGRTFAMGSTTDCSDADGPACIGDRVPHKVRISSFALDDTEVTQRQYAACVHSGGCDSDGATFGAGDDTPVLVDDPALARKYCMARKTPMRLPTEAEFEFASRVASTGDETDYTWGSFSSPPSCERLPFAGCAEQRPRAVGTTPGDVSPSGIHDLAGSVPEWVEDDYSPYIGCADHLSYGELCWGKSGGCAATRCTTDGAICAHGCLAGPSTANPTGGDATAPVCGLPPDAALVIDPLVKGASPFGVIRGGGPTDNACAFAAFTRRHAAPKSFAAGFRCALSVDKLPRKPTLTYRFSVDGCPPNGRIRMLITLASGMPAAYSLDYFQIGASTPTSVTPMAGLVDDVPCEAVFVVYPPGTTDPITLKLNSVGSPTCLGASRMIALGAGDTPPAGTDSVPLASASDCL